MHSIATQGHIASAMALIGEASRVYLLSRLQCAMLVGDKLNEAKKLVDHGEWLTCRKADGRFSERMAQKYMQAADRREEIEEQIRLGNSDLTLDQMLAFLAKKKPASPATANRKVKDSKTTELNNKASGDLNAGGGNSTPVSPLPEPCTTTGDVAQQNSDAATVDAAVPTTPCEVTEPSVESPVDQPLPIDQVAELKRDHEPPAGSETVNDAECVPSVPSPAAVTLADKFAKYRVGSQEDVFVSMAVDHVVEQAREEIAKEASRISTKSAFVQDQWSPEMLACVIANRVAAALHTDS